MGERFAHEGGRNIRTVWTIATQPYPGAHFATFPEKLVEPCILAGSRPGDLVFDPFVGSGTTLRVAYKHQRKAIGLDISFNYLINQAIERSRNVQINLFV
jgi:site-specific DNA-methyltransferase (cytosine-N4-specific)